MRTVDDINFNRKRAIIRVDFNVPLNDKHVITDDTRIQAALPTIRKIINDGGSVILISHLGRPKAQEDKFSLKHVVARLSQLLDGPVKFSNDCIGAETDEIVKSLQPGEVLLLENLRFREDEKNGDQTFARQLADHADVYVNDAFGTAHRAHASTTIIAKYFKPEARCFGYLMRDEINSLEKVLSAPKKPFTAILGGAKVSDKVQIIENLLPKIDNLIIGGAMAYTFAKALGGTVGKSLVEDDKLQLARQLIEKAKAQNVELMLPVDTNAATDFHNDADAIQCPTDAIPDDRMGLDIGSEAVKLYQDTILKSETVLWNGPMGVFEFPNFQDGTRAVAQACADATARNGAFTLVGGGDSVTAVNQFRLGDRVSYVSTGGGAMLEYLEGKVLPAIAAQTE